MSIPKYRQPKSSAGFSIVEFGVTIILLGVIFVMTLKGAALVESMRAFMTTVQISKFQNAVMSYREAFNALPGDDAQGPRRWGRPDAIVFFSGAPVSYANDARINGQLFDILNPNGENFIAWADLRGYGAVPGDITLVGFSAMPENLFGGVYGFDEGNLGQEGGSLCATRVPGGAAQKIDARMDDGIIDRGRVVATSKYDATNAHNHFDAPDSAPYDIEKEYIICAPILP